MAAAEIETVRRLVLLDVVYRLLTGPDLAARMGRSALIGAGRHHLCLKASSGVQDAASGILVREGRFDADDAS